jgi:hypothetical protein
LPPGLKPGVKIEKYDRFGNIVQTQALGIKYIEIRFKGRSLVIDRYMNVSIKCGIVILIESYERVLFIGRGFI